MSAHLITGFARHEDRQNVVAFKAHLLRLEQFPPSACMVVSLDGSDARHPFEVFFPVKEVTSTLRPYLDTEVGVVLGPRRPCGGLVSLDLALVSLRWGSDEPCTAHFDVVWGPQRRSHSLVVPVTVQELAMLAAYFGAPAQLTLGIFEESRPERRTTPA